MLFRSGPKGERGDPGVIEAQYPLVLDSGVLTLDSSKFSELLNKFQNKELQQTINKIVSSIPTGGGAVGIKYGGNYVIKSVSDVNFTGSGVTVISKGKGVEVNIPSSNPQPAIQYTIFTESTTPPVITLVGDRWFNTNTGILYTAISSGPNLIWVQL